VNCLEATEAILLRKTKLTETSLIVTWLTESEGKLKTVAKGARSQKSRFAGLLDLFHRCEVQIARSRKSELHALTEVVLLDPHDQIRFDYHRLTLAAYFVELIDLVTELEHPSPEMFDLLRRALSHLDTHPASRRALLHFEAELARVLGIQQPTVTPAVAIGRSYHRLPVTRHSLVESLS
jgi:DNA repair protein RecO (recombination protein O)